MIPTIYLTIHQSFVCLSTDLFIYLFLKPFIDILFSVEDENKWYNSIVFVSCISRNIREKLGIKYQYRISVRMERYFS